MSLILIVTIIGCAMSLIPVAFLCRELIRLALGRDANRAN